MRTKIVYVIAGVLALWVLKDVIEKRVVVGYVRAIGENDSANAEMVHLLCPHIEDPRVSALCARDSDVMAHSAQESLKLYEKLR